MQPRRRLTALTATVLACALLVGLVLFFLGSPGSLGWKEGGAGALDRRAGPGPIAISRGGDDIAKPEAATPLRWSDLLGGPATPEGVEPSGGRRTAAPPWILSAMGLEEDAPATTNRERILGGSSYHPDDLAALNDIIASNRLDESTSPFDYDDGNGVLEPWEVGFQVWLSGRLVALSLGPDRFSSFGYGVSRLPASIENLEMLRYLDVHGSELVELPPELGQLSQLRELHSFRNHLSALPASLVGLGQLRVLSVSENSLEALPEGIGAPNLVMLYVRNNPGLVTLPDSMRDLPLLHLDVRGTGLAHGAGAPASLAALLADLPLQTLYAGAELRGAPPESLEHISRVYFDPGYTE